MREKWRKYSPYVLLGGSFLLLLLLNVFRHDQWLDSDMAAEMMFSRLLAQEGRFFATPDWYYSTEFRFLYTHWIMGPLFRILANWHVIRTITNLVSYVLMVAAYYFFMKPFDVKRERVVASSAILLLPFSETMMTHMVMGNTYLFHVIIVFTVFGLFLRLAGGHKGKRVVWLVCYLVFAVICGVSGVRYLLALQCPLVLTSLVGIFRSADFAQLRREWSDRETGEKNGKNGKSGKTLWLTLGKSVSAKYLWYSLLGAAGSVAGYAVNVLYVSRRYVFQTYDATNFIAVYQGILMERIQNAIGSLIMLFGYIPDRGVLSLRGVITLVAFLLLAVFGYCSVQAGKECKGQRGFVTWFLYVSFLLNLFVFVFTTSTMVPRYYLTIYIFLLPVLCFYLEKEEHYFDRLAVCVLLILGLTLATGKTVLSYVTIDKNADRRKVAAALEEQGLKFGYATYWNGNILTELTNGQVEIANVGDGIYLDYFKWSSPMKYYADDYAEGQVFLLLSAEELEEAVAAGARTVQEGRVVYADNAYTVLVYDSAAKLRSLAAER
ncbi:MAG: hypothetical protein IJ716_16330 [Lachnospiraceae bacterium]|nr:hypothetical protein [Lachnospiraceae bacterium]